VAFDGLSRTRWWSQQVLELQGRYVLDHPTLADVAVTLFNLAGLLGAIAVVAVAYLAAVQAARGVAGTDLQLTGAFVWSLVPIALAYAVAHYFSLLLREGQLAIRLVSDPFGNGWDLFGSADFKPDYAIISPNMVWYVQVAALVAGHVAGLVVAHDRAVSLFSSAQLALRTQYAMLTLMVLYTAGGLWLLSRG
ncbi:MAG: fenitrothion hydrolase, partial [Thermoleophilia bacterium]|nr:fenitrothion hydrolase [Thermoleophilia bacterium]